MDKKRKIKLEVDVSGHGNQYSTGKLILVYTGQAGNLIIELWQAYSRRGGGLGRQCSVEWMRLNRL